MDRWLMRILAVAQIGGGFFGIMLVFQTFTGDGRNTISNVINSVFMVVFGLGVIAGVALLEDSKAGIILSRIYQLLQIPILSSPFLEYGFASGFFADVRFAAGSFNWNMAAGSRYVFLINGNGNWLFGLNIVAMLFFVYLLTIKVEKRSLTKVSDEQTQNYGVRTSPVRQQRRNEFLYADASKSDSGSRQYN